LQPGGKVVIVYPEWNLRSGITSVPDDPDIYLASKDLGYGIRIDAKHQAMLFFTFY